MYLYLQFIEKWNILNIPSSTNIIFEKPILNISYFILERVSKLNKLIY